MELKDGSTSDQLYGVAETVAHLSTGVTLEPGTIIATGTPAGQGSSLKPPVWLKNGDEVRISVSIISSNVLFSSRAFFSDMSFPQGDHGLGTLINYIKFEKSGSLVSKL
jgi:hypothetical protein